MNLIEQKRLIKKANKHSLAVKPARFFICVASFVLCFTDI